MKLAPRAPARRSETRDLTRPVRAALNTLPGVRVARNVDRGLMTPYKMRLLPRAPKILTGLGKGGSDLVGIVAVADGPSSFTDEDGCVVPRRVKLFGRAFVLELKWYDARKAHKDTRRDQERWRAAVIRLGGFAGLIEARSTEDAIAQAVAAVERCRAGASS